MSRFTQWLLLVNAAVDAVLSIIWDVYGRLAREPSAFAAVVDAFFLAVVLCWCWAMYQTKAPTHTDAEDLA